MTPLTSVLRLLALAAVSTAALTGCVAAGDDGVTDADDAAEGDDGVTDTDEAALKAGKNGGACAKSPYNCKLRVEGGNRTETNAGSELWSVYEGPIFDGHGNEVGTNNYGRLRFNYGQDRYMHGREWVYAMTSSMNTGGWFPLDLVKGAASLEKKHGEVTAKSPGKGHLGCYKIRDSHNEGMAPKKVVFDTQSTNERAGDYMALPRANGRRYANLCFNTPGFGLGGVAIDMYPSGTHFQRVEVPTESGAPSISVPLWVQDSNGNYTKRSGSMKFVYGFVNSKVAGPRFGWMALEALAPAPKSEC